MQKTTKRIKVNFSDSSRYLPFIRIKIQDEQVLALVDSGSEVTMMDTLLAERLKGGKYFKVDNKGNNLSIHGIGGQSASCSTNIFYCLINLEGENEDKGNVTVSGIIYDMEEVRDALKESSGGEEVLMIIGSDMLRFLRVNVNYVKKQVMFIVKNNSTAAA